MTRTIADGDTLDGFPRAIAGLRAIIGGTAAELAEMPSVGASILGRQKRIATARAALGELDVDEIVAVLVGLAERKGPVWVENIARDVIKGVGR